MKRAPDVYLPRIVTPLRGKPSRNVFASIRHRHPESGWRTGGQAALVLMAAGILSTLIAGTAAGAGPGVHGRVFALDDSGQTTGAVSGAKIEFRSTGGTAQAPVTSGPNGYYRIDLPPGQYTYKVTATGFRDEDQGRGIVLQLSDGYALYNFSLSKGKNPENRRPPELPVVEVGQLQGQVLEQTAQGEQTGIPGARITLRREGGGRELVRVTSQRAPRPDKPVGFYGVELTAGTYRASVAALGFETLADPQSISIAVGQTTERNFVLKRSATEPPSDQGIRGVVRLGEPRPAGKPGLQIRVQIIPVGPGAPGGPPLTPDAKGRYSRSLAEGRYRVLAQAEGYRPARSGPRQVFRSRYTIVNLTLVPLTPPEAPPPLVVTPPSKIKPPTEMKPPVETPKLTFRGVVLEALPGGQKTRPLPDAFVLLRKQGENLLRAQRGTTDQRGEVTLPVADAGTYAFVARLPGYVPGGASVEITAGGDNTKTIILKRAGTAEAKEPPETMPGVAQPERPEGVQPQTVTGFVVYRSPSSPTGVFGVPGVELLWRRTTGLVPVRREATSAARGAFSLSLPPGTYQVELKPPQGYRADSQEVSVRPGMSSAVLYVTRTEPVTPGADTEGTGLVTLNLRILERADTRGQRPIAGAMVGVVRNRQRVRVGQSSAEGGLTFQLPSGTYQIRAQHSGYESGQDSVTLNASPVSRDIYLRRASSGGVEDTTPGGATPGGVVPGGDVRPAGVLQLEILGVTRGRPGMAPQPLPLGGSRIVILRGGRVIDTGQSEANGRYLTRLAPGSYEIKVTHEKFLPAAEQVELSGVIARRRIVLRSAATSPERPDTPSPGPRPGIDKPQPTAGLLDLQVLGLKLRRAGTAMTPAPLAGAQIVVLQNGRPAASGQSDGGGRYRTRLPPGAYEVKVTLDRFIPGLEQIAVSGGQTVQRRIVLRPAAGSVEQPPETPRPPSIRPTLPKTPSFKPRIKVPLR